MLDTRQVLERGGPSHLLPLKSTILCCGQKNVDVVIKKRLLQGGQVYYFTMEIFVFLGDASSG